MRPGVPWRLARFPAGFCHPWVLASSRGRSHRAFLPGCFPARRGTDFQPASSFSPEHLLPVAPVCVSAGPGQITPFPLLAGGRGEGSRSGERQGRRGHCRKTFCPQVTPVHIPAAPGEGRPSLMSSSCWKDCSGQRPGNRDTDRSRALSKDTGAQSRVSTNPGNSHH